MDMSNSPALRVLLVEDSSLLAARLTELIQRLPDVELVDTADTEAITMLLVGAIHGQVLPRVLVNPPGSPVTMPSRLAVRLATTIMNGFAPRAGQRPPGPDSRR